MVDVASGTISTVAGNRTSSITGDDGDPATDVGIQAWAVAIDGYDRLYIAEDCRVRRVDHGEIFTFAGALDCGYTLDGEVATDARFYSINSIAADAVGNVYVADLSGSVRKVDAVTGIVTTMWSNATGLPITVAVDPAGQLYISEGPRIHRVFGTTHEVVAGNGTYGYSGDGGSSLAARINTGPLAADGAGNLYIENGMCCIRRISGLPVPPGDATPPLIEPDVTGTFGANGWYTSDVTVSWAVTDAESSVTSATDCDTSTVLADSADAEFTCSATSAGGTSSETVHVHRDATPPGATASASPFPNANGWNSGDVTVHIAGTDATSGIASCTADSC